MDPAESNAMTWAKLSDETWTDPVLTALSDRAFRLHIACLAYCADKLTDGALTARQVEQVAFMFGLTDEKELKATIAELVKSDLWESGQEYSIIDFLESNPSKAKDEETRTM